MKRMRKQRPDPHGQALGRSADALCAVTFTRVLDDPFWAPSSGAWTAVARLQLFEQEGRAAALITQQEGDLGSFSHINLAENFYHAVAAECARRGLTPPECLYFNRLGDLHALGNDGRDEICFERGVSGEVVYRSSRAMSPTAQQSLTIAGAQWDAGRPPNPAPPGRVLAWLKVPFGVIPLPHKLFRDLNTYRTVDWSAAVDAAIAHLNGYGRKEYSGLTEAAASLMIDPIYIEGMQVTGDTVAGASLGNGQHRTQAMREQHVRYVLISAIRDADDPPFPHEIATEELDGW